MLHPDGPGDPRNAALVEHASAAAQTLQDEAARLAQTVGGFKLYGVSPSAGPAACVAVARPAPTRLAVKAPVKPVQAKPAAKAQVTADNEAWGGF